MSNDQTPASGSWADVPITRPEDDWLGFGEYVNGLKQMLATTDTPFTLGVYGDWGVGKTSLMKLLQAAMDADGHVTVWLNAWERRQREEVPQTLMRAAYGEVKARLHLQSLNWKQVTGELKKGGAHALSLAAQLAAAGDVGDEVSALLEMDSPGGSAFRAAFDDNLRQLFGRDARKRFVVFVDELDQCGRDSALETLETLKVHLGVERCVFVIGASENTVCEAIGRKYPGRKKDGQLSADAVRYLEKLAVVPFHIPPPNEQRVDALIANLVDPRRLPTGVEHSRWTAFLRLVAKAMAGNPRRVKRFLASMHLVDKVAPESVLLEGDAEQTPLCRLKLAKVVLLQHAFPEFWEWVRRYPELLWRYQLRVTEPESKQLAPEAEGYTEQREPGPFGRFAGVSARLARDPLLCELLAGEPLWGEREASHYATHAASTCSSPAEPGFDQLHDDLLCGDAELVRAAAQRVKEAGDASLQARAHVDALTEVLQNAGARRAADAACALGAIGGPPAVAALVEALAHKSPRVREVAVAALGRTGSADALPALSKRLRDKEPPVREASAWALGRIGGSAAVEALVKVLKPADADLRRTILAALESIGTPEAKQALAEVKGRGASEEPAAPPSEKPPATQRRRGPKAER